MTKKTSSMLNDQTWNNPFIDLKIDLPEPPPPPPPPKPTPEEEKQAKLTKEDMELLKAFGDASIGHDPEEKTTGSHRGKVTFQIQRKGKGGKTVTNVRGLEGLGISEQMALCSEVKSALGIGARFLEGTLELQGDQTSRAREWFKNNGFNA